MGLSNVERQRRYIARLKVRAGGAEQSATVAQKEIERLRERIVKLEAQIAGAKKPKAKRRD